MFVGARGRPTETQSCRLQQPADTRWCRCPPAVTNEVQSMMITESFYESVMMKQAIDESRMAKFIPGFGEVIGWSFESVPFE